MNIGVKGLEKNRWLIITIENIAIFLIVFSAIANIVLSLPNMPDIFQDIGEYYTKIAHPNLVIYNLLRRIIGFVLLLISHRLYKRMHFAWIITLATLTFSIALNLIRLHVALNPLIFFELLIIIILLLCQNDFKRQSDKISVNRGILLACFSIFLIILNTSIGFFSLKHHFIGIKDFSDCIENSIHLLFFMDTSLISKTNAGILYADFAMYLNWICIFFSLFFILKPLVYNPVITKRQRDDIYQLVNNYGQNPMSYLALENDKKYFFPKFTEGAIAFGIVGDVAVCCGDIICAEENINLVLAEFMLFCKQNNYSILFLNVTEKFLNQYKTMGFENVKYGEDACFRLFEYNLSGGKVAKVRAAINHATKAGITVTEYKPKEEKDMKIESEINQVSHEWLSTKKSNELAFMLGGIGLDEPRDRRFFIAKDVEGKILGFVVFVPYLCKNGYLADVTRRRNDAPQGVLEKIIFEAFMVFKEEGVEWGNLGLVPLANVREENASAKLTTRLFEFVYENLNAAYGFKPLHHAKDKYAPTHWMPRYLVYYPRLFTPQIAYAIVKIQNPNGLKDYILPILQKKILFK